MSSANERTLATYERSVQRYVDGLAEPPPRYLRWLDAFVALLPPGARVLELGCGPGRDADLLEERGVTVDRTDATAAFVDRLRETGTPARLLNAITDDFGGPYDAVFASAVLLHLSREDVARVLDKAAAATGPDGVLAFDVKEGDGDGWSTAKLDLPRHFTYWRRDALQELLDRSPWQVVSMSGYRGRVENWIEVLARRP